MKVQIVKPDGKTFVATDNSQPGVVNNLIHSLFQSCMVSLNGKTITVSPYNYNYRAYIETLLNYGQDAAETHLTQAGWYFDKQTSNIKKEPDEDYQTRSSLYKNSAVIELYSRVTIDSFKKYILNGVDIQIKFVLAKPEFYLMKEEGKINILESVLYVNDITIAPELMTAHNATLLKRKARYHYSTVEVKSFSVAANTHDINLNNVITGRIPKRVIIGFVDNSGYTGDLLKNPFNFKHCSISQFQLFVNGVGVPSEPIVMNMGTNEYTRAYNTLFKGTSVKHHNFSHQITKEAFVNGSFLLSFDLTADHSADCNYSVQQINDGIISIRAKLNKSLATPTTVIVYAEYDTVLEISLNREVFGPY